MATVWDDQLRWLAWRGTVFRITASGKFKISTISALRLLYRRQYPLGSLVLASNGDFYGTTEYGGHMAKVGLQNHVGWALTTLYSFCAVSSTGPGTTMPRWQDSSECTDSRADGNLYGRPMVAVGVWAAALPHRATATRHGLQNHTGWSAVHAVQLLFTDDLCRW